MKKHLWEKATALALVLSLFISLLSVPAAAEGTGTGGEEPVPEVGLLSDDGTAEGANTDEEEQPAEGSQPEPQAEQTGCEEGKHTPDLEKGGFMPDYTPCGGGYETAYYTCTVCQAAVTADGEPVERTDGAGKHILGSEKHEADYTLCGGGRQKEYYTCTACARLVNADGSPADWAEGNGEHQIISFPATAPTYEENGWLAHWICSVCNRRFPDSKGKEHFDIDSFWLPPLKRDTEVTTESLTVVPASVAGKYATVKAIQTALLEIAKAAGFDAGQKNAGSVLFDVNLQIKNADGTMTSVSPENFPEEGVTVVLPFPAGTNQNYTFVITHMITYGARAGQIEVLPSVNTEGGICARFTSMSPVCISYMLQSSTPAPETPAPETPAPETPAPETPEPETPAPETPAPETPAPEAPAPEAPAPETSAPETPEAPVSTVPKTSDAAHGAPWGMLALLSIAGLGALFIAGKKLRSF